MNKTIKLIYTLLLYFQYFYLLDVKNNNENNNEMEINPIIFYFQFCRPRQSNIDKTNIFDKGRVRTKTRNFIDKFSY